MTTARIPTTPRSLGSRNHKLMAWACIGLIAATTGVASARAFRRAGAADSFTETADDASDALRSYSSVLQDTIAAAGSCSDELRTLAREYPARVIRAALMQEGMLTAPLSPDAASIALDRLLVARGASFDALAADMATLVNRGADAVPALGRQLACRTCR